MRIAKKPVSSLEPCRLGGGPRLPRLQHDWWVAQVDRIAGLEGLQQCSIATLLIRIANADLDLSLIGLAHYRKKRPAA